MKEAQVSVLFEIPLSDDEKRHLNDPEFWRQGMEAMRRQADMLAAQKGGHVVTDRKPSFTKPQVAAHPILGNTVLLWASRWWVEVPDSVDVEHLTSGV